MDSSKRSENKGGQAVEIRVPALPESVSDATLVAWHKRAGDAVRRDENLVDIETDKVVFELPAPQDGVLENVFKQDGDTVVGGEVIAALVPGDGEPAAETPAPAPATTQPKQAAAALSPSVRRLIEQHNLDPAAIPATGKDGRLTKADVLAYMEDKGTESVEPPRPAAQPGPAPDSARPQPAPSPEAPPAADQPGVTRVPMSRLRQRIAERMVEAQQTAAILTTFNDINMQAVQALRNRYKEPFQKRYDTKLGFMSFFVKACVEALRQFPVVNASVEGQDILYHDFYDIGIAVSSPRGLVVPVLREADRRSFAEIESEITDFAQRAREGTLGIDELTGGTFTITNGGVFGSLLSTPIINPPQSAILGMHKIEERPVVENGQVVVRPMMYVALSYDHRIIDGREAVQFLVNIKQSIEDPARLLLDV